jgi:hypothetical protein
MQHTIIVCKRLKVPPKKVKIQEKGCFRFIAASTKLLQGEFRFTAKETSENQTASENRNVIEINL